jgi:hypothetical protein
MTKFFKKKKKQLNMQLDLKKLIFIKDACFEELPVLSALLTAALKITRIDPQELLLNLSSTTGQMEPDLFLKIVIFAEGLTQTEFDAFAELVRASIRASSKQNQNVINQFPTFFVSCQKDGHFLLAGL